MNIKVTQINGNFHARLFEQEKILDEMACNLKCDIGWICREMLRWQDKLGNCNEQTKFARSHQHGYPIGKVWYDTEVARLGLKKAAK